MLLWCPHCHPPGRHDQHFYCPWRDLLYTPSTHSVSPQYLTGCCCSCIWGTYFLYCCITYYLPHFIVHVERVMLCVQFFYFTTILWKLLFFCILDFQSYHFLQFFVVYRIFVLKALLRSINCRISSVIQAWSFFFSVSFNFVGLTSFTTVLIWFQVSSTLFTSTLL